MSEIPPDLYYTREHEYLKETPEEGVYVVGITDYAQGELGDVVYVELPAAGDSFAKMEPFGTIEAVKAVSDLYCPVRGEIVEVKDGRMIVAAQVGRIHAGKAKLDDGKKVAAAELFSSGQLKVGSLLGS